MTTVIRGGFEWDDEKAAANERKHGVAFEEASSVFEDLNHLVNADPSSADRFIAVGLSRIARVLIVVHVERGDRVRLISARRATVNEERLYADRRL